MSGVKTRAGIIEVRDNAELRIDLAAAQTKIERLNNQLEVRSAECRGLRIELSELKRRLKLDPSVLEGTIHDLRYRISQAIAHLLDEGCEACEDL